MIMAFLTNCIIDAVGEECSEGEAGLSKILLTLFVQAGGIFNFCQTFPAIRFFISPPSVRNRPSWYPRFRPVILRALQQVLLTRPSNLQLLEDFSGTLDPDGIHYNILSGMNYVQDLHDQVVQLLQQPPPDPSIRYSYVFIGYVSHVSYGSKDSNYFFGIGSIEPCSVSNLVIALVHNFAQQLWGSSSGVIINMLYLIIITNFSNPAMVHGARISGLEERMSIVEDHLSDVNARGSEESDNLANERDLDRFIMTGDL